MSPATATPNKRKRPSEKFTINAEGKKVQLETDASEVRTVRAWGAIFWLGILHMGAIMAFFCPSWEGLALTLGLHWLTGGLGICLGFHRLLTHSSFSTYPIVKWTLSLIHI